MGKTRMLPARGLLLALTTLIVAPGIYAASLAAGVLFETAPGNTPTAHAQQPFCPPGQEPHSAFGFKDLHNRLGEKMGDPLTCEFPDPNGTGDVQQRTSGGLAFWRKSTNTPTFTNGYEHWAITDRGFVYWLGDSIDPTADAVPEPAPASDSVPFLEPIDGRDSIGGIPACAHDPGKWHGVVEYASDGSIACTYDHEHKDDPRVLDDVFGPLKYGEISYPWETHRENELKHRVYAWATIEDVLCAPAFAPYGFTNARLQSHNDGNVGATTRFHSFFFQGETCDPNDPSWRGKVTIGGHMDFGRLTVLTNGGEVHVPLDNDPDPGVNLALRRIHGSPEKARDDFTWYGANRTSPSGSGVLLEIGIRQEDWGPVDPNDPYRLLFYGGNQSGSWIEPMHLVALRIDHELDGLDGVVDGFVTYEGYTDRYGNIVQGCTEAGVDCVPLKLERMKVGTYQFRADMSGIEVRDYDVRGPDGASLIQHPN